MTISVTDDPPKLPISDKELIEHLSNQVRNLSMLLDQQLGTPCEQIRNAEEIARLTRERDDMKRYMVPLHEDGSHVFIDGPGDVELDHGGKLRSRDLTAEAKLADAVAALGPFADSIFNDNGDITTSFRPFTAEELQAAYFARRRARSITEKEVTDDR